MYTLNSTPGQTLISFNRPMACLSWAPHNGGRRNGISHILNRTLPRNELRTLPQLQADLARNLRDSALNPAAVVAMLTTVPQDYLGLAEREGSNEFMVTAACTVGLGNALAPGEHAAYDEESGSQTYRAGTINIMVFINRRLEECAALELSNIISLSKAAVMADLRLTGRRHGRLKLATGTDCNAVCWDPDHGVRLQYAGLHTRLAELTANAVRSAMLKSLSLRLGLPDQPESRLLTLAHSRLTAS
ncbi:MAG TPA: adenosylcobinamide amidohydrolase [bacterium]|nr:MAG: Adenosylcobinamide amidohydrolase [Parcubacteria group bacterium ADurb.Bin192]HPN15154.1 adenosylcobinamide amidohydrolase [bacterium]